MATLNLDVLRKALNEQAGTVFEDGRSTHYGARIPCPQCNRLTQWVEQDQQKTFTMHPCGHQMAAGTGPSNDPIQSHPIASVGTITWGKIADGAVETGNIIEDLRNSDPKMVEALILTALSRTTLNGMTDIGMDQARRFLGIYRAHVIEQSQQP